MATSPIGLQQGYGIGSGVQNLAPFSIIANRAPTTLDRARIGTFWAYTGANNIYCLTSVTNGVSNWLTLSNGGAGVFLSLTVNGPSTFAGNIVQQAPGVTAAFLATTTAGLTNNGAFANTGAFNQTGNSIFQNTGALTSLDLRNTDNTQTAGSRLTIQVTDQQAGRVGDPQINFNNDGVWQYAVGLDSSNGQSFSIAIGASLGAPNNIFTSTLQGAINLPKQPCFVLILNDNGGTGAYNNVTGGPIPTANIWDIGNPLYVGVGGPSQYNVILNNGAGVINANGQYVIPVTGRYLFNCQVRLSNVGTATGCQLRLIKNASFIGVVENNCNVSSTGFLTLSTSSIVECNAGDVIYQQIQVVGMAGDTASVNSDGATYLSTYLTGALLN